MPINLCSTFRDCRSINDDMFTNFSKAERAVHFPSDKRRFIGVKPAVIIVCITLLLDTAGMTWLQYLVFGLPADPSTSFPPLTASDPTGYASGFINRQVLKKTEWGNIST